MKYSINGLIWLGLSVLLLSLSKKNDAGDPAEGTIDPLIIPAANKTAALKQDRTSDINLATLLL